MTGKLGGKQLSAAVLVALVLAWALLGGRAAATPAASLTSTASAGIPPTQFGVPLRGGGLLEGATRRRILHFTFDDGPDAKLTPRLLDLLDREGWKATFFFSTSRFDSKQRRTAQAPDLAREVARRGHQLGSHGFQHQHMGRLAPPQLREQLSQSDALFQRVFGTRTFLFRPPFGSRNAALDQLLSEGEYVTAIWNIGMADWVAREPEAIRTTFWRVIERNEQTTGDRGGIVLMHDTHPWSIDAFALIADSIRARNCALLATAQELYDVVDSMAPWVEPMSDEAYMRRQQQLRERLASRCPAQTARTP